MHKRWDFFKEADSSFGLFYPRHYIVAGFESLSAAEAAEAALRESGIAHEDVRAADGSFVVDHVESQKDASFLDRIKEGIARTLGTEAGYIDDDMKLAKRGGAFVFIYAPDNAIAESVHEQLKRLHPIFARRYLPMAIERLIYPKQSVL